MTPGPDSDGDTDRNGERTGLPRRQFLAAQSMLAAGSIAGLGTGVASADSQESIENTVTVDADSRSGKSTTRCSAG
ncbi:hypothetical protein ACFQL4_20220 [Halosimplex aquaticum]